MPLMQLILTLVLIGVGLFLLDQIPMDITIRRIIKAVVIVVVVLWLVRSLGLLNVGPVITFKR